MSPQAPHLVWIGFDARQAVEVDVAAVSLFRTSPGCVYRTLGLGHVQGKGLYTRPTETRGTGYWDVISEAPMSTGHAIARFLVPALMDYQGWALFTDGDVLYRKDLAGVFASADPSKAIQVVQHTHAPTETTKMDGQVQTAYARKNWSSVMLFNCAHPANRALTAELVNTVPGRDLHRFCWLPDDLIGALDPQWNVLIGEEDHPDPGIAHFTLGTPLMEGYEHQPFANEWFVMAEKTGHFVRRPVKATA